MLFVQKRPFQATCACALQAHRDGAVPLAETTVRRDGRKVATGVKKRLKESQTLDLIENKPF